MNETSMILSPEQHPARVDLLARLQAVRDSYLDTMSPNTRRAYIRDLIDFAKFMETDPDQALRTLMENGPGEANATALQYKAELLNRGLKPSTVNRRLYSLRSSIKLARMSGFITRALELTGGNLPAVQDFSRHAKTETLRIYDDNRGQRGGKVAQMVASEAAL